MDQADNLLVSEVTIPGQDILVKYKRVVLLLSVILIGIAVGSGSAIQPV
jgi:hypothetical protein